MEKGLRKIQVLLAMILVVTLCLPQGSDYPVTKAYGAALRLNKTSVKAYAGDKVQLKLGNVTQNITWTSSKKSVAVVSKKGKVTCKKAGTAKITAAYKKKKYTCTVKVSKRQAEEAVIFVRGVNIKLGEKEEDILKKLGRPSETEASYYGNTTYIYNDDYEKFLMIDILDGKAVGLYTDSLDFNFKGITMNGVNKDAGKMDNYYVKVYVDEIGTNKVCGIRILSTQARPNPYKDNMMQDMEKQIFYLTNSIRVRNSLPALSWSGAASLCARRHSEDMAGNHYFSHIDKNGGDMGDRLTKAGVVWFVCGENIAAGQRDCVEVVHGWFQSFGHRINILEPEFAYLGVGMAYNQSDAYGTYYTQNFYK